MSASLRKSLGSKIMNASVSKLRVPPLDLCRTQPTLSAAMRPVDVNRQRFSMGVLPRISPQPERCVSASTTSSNTQCSENVNAIVESALKRGRGTPRFLRAGYQPLSVLHPVFGQLQALVGRQPKRVPLSTAHPAFGTKRTAPQAQSLFRGPIGVSGFFLAVDPNVALGPIRPRNQMNPNAQLTIRDQLGNSSRVRYRCQLEAVGGLKVEAIVRFQVGWISPRVVFSQVPNVIHLGRGFDISVPFLFHFTMVSVLDERGCATGSSLYFSGTPMLGLSIGCSLIRGGKLVMDPSRDMNPTHEAAHHFFGSVHYRQIGFVVFKFLMWLLFALACLPSVWLWIVAILPNPFERFSEGRAQKPPC